MSKISKEQKEAIRCKLNSMKLCKGMGTNESACSMAAINLALSANLTDEIPDCMSNVIGKWIIYLQDKMPTEIRNSKKWKSLLPNAVGTGREKEYERIAIIMDWIWITILPNLQLFADLRGFGKEWRNMLSEKTSNAADTAYIAANGVYPAAYAAYAAEAAGDAARCAASNSAAGVAIYSSYVVADFNSVAIYAAIDDIWVKIDPCGLLEKLINA